MTSLNQGPSGPYTRTGFESAIGQISPVSAANPLPVTSTGSSVSQAPFPATNGSTSITLGGTAQNLFSGATPVNGYEVINPSANEDLWISDTTTAAANAQGSIRVAMNGGAYVTPPGYKPLGAVSVFGATTGHVITARMW